MLRHALKIQAQEDYQRIIINMVPHLDKNSRREIIDSYKRILDENKEASNDIINEDRKRLRALLSKTKWQKQQK